MAQEKQNTKYYAVDSCNSDTSCNSSGSEIDHSIIKIAVDGGDTDTTYSCTGTVTITASGTLYEDTTEDLQTGDVTLVIKNLSTDTATDTIDLVSFRQSSGTITRPLKFDIVGNDSKEVTASLYLENTENDQNKLAGKELNLTIKASNVQCPIKQAD